LEAWELISLLTTLPILAIRKERPKPFTPFLSYTYADISSYICTLPNATTIISSVESSNATIAFTSTVSTS